MKVITSGSADRSKSRTLDVTYRTYTELMTDSDIGFGDRVLNIAQRMLLKDEIFLKK